MPEVARALALSTHYLGIVAWAVDLVVDSVKAMVGFARLFRPRYAWANLEHPSLLYMRMAA